MRLYIDRTWLTANHLKLMKSLLAQVPEHDRTQVATQIDEILTYHHEEYTAFRQYYLLGDGACGFYGLGFNRKDAVDQLVKAIKASPKDGDVLQLIAQEMQENGERFTHQASLTEQETKQALINYVVDKYETKKEALAFTQVIGNQTGHGVIAALAYLRKASVEIYQVSDNAENKALTCTYRYTHPNEETKIHLFYDAAHFNLLIPAGASNEIHEKAQSQASLFAYARTLSEGQIAPARFIKTLKEHESLPQSLYQENNAEGNRTTRKDMYDTFLEQGQLPHGLNLVSFRYRLMFDYLNEVTMLREDGNTNRTLENTLEQFSYCLGLAKLGLVYQHHKDGRLFALLIQQYVQEIIKFKCTQSNGAQSGQETEYKRLKHYALMYQAEIAIQYPDISEKTKYEAWIQLSHQKSALGRYTKTAYLTLLRLVLSMSEDERGELPNAYVLIKSYIKVLAEHSQQARKNTNHTPKDQTSSEARRHRCHPVYINETINTKFLKDLNNILTQQSGYNTQASITAIRGLPRNASEDEGEVSATRAGARVRTIQSTGLKLTPNMQATLFTYIHQSETHQSVIAPQGSPHAHTSNTRRVPSSSHAHNSNIRRAPRPPQRDTILQADLLIADSSDTPIPEEEHLGPQYDISTIEIIPLIEKQSPIINPSPSAQTTQKNRKALSLIIAGLLFSNKPDYAEFESFLRNSEKQKAILVLNNRQTLLSEVFLFLAPGSNDANENVINTIKSILEKLKQNLPISVLQDCLTRANQDGFTPLHEALISGDATIVSAYLEQVIAAGLDKSTLIKLLTKSNEAGFTPLHEALKSRDATIVSAYLEQVIAAGLDNSALITLLTKSNKAGFTPLHEALMSGDARIVSAYLEQVIAAELDKSALITLLTEPNEAGFTPLHSAVSSGSVEIVKAYLEQVIAAELDKSALITLLTKPNKDGFTPLHDALISGDATIVKAYLEQVIAAELDKSALITLLTESNEDGFTPLHSAVSSGSVEIVKAYLEQVIAAELDNSALIKLLTKSNKDGFTPLHQALISGSPEIVKAYLEQVIAAELDKSALIMLLTKPNKDGFTPLHDALKSGDARIVSAYLEQVIAAELDKSTLITLLTEPNEAGFTPLHDALSSGDATIVKAYLEQVIAAELDKSTLITLLTKPNKDGFTPLHQALISGDATIVSAYLEQVIAAELDKSTLIKLLTKSNKAGFTPLHQALKSGSPEIVKAYLEQVIKAKLGDPVLITLLTKPNKAGYTPLLQGVKNTKSVESIRLLLSEFTLDLFNKDDIKRYFKQKTKSEHNLFDAFLANENEEIFKELLSLLNKFKFNKEEQSELMQHLFDDMITTNYKKEYMHKTYLLPFKVEMNTSESHGRRRSNAPREHCNTGHRDDRQTRGNGKKRSRPAGFNNGTPPPSKKHRYSLFNSDYRRRPANQSGYEQISGKRPCPRNVRCSSPPPKRPCYGRADSTREYNGYNHSDRGSSGNKYFFQDSGRSDTHSGRGNTHSGRNATHSEGRRPESHPTDNTGNFARGSRRW